MANAGRVRPNSDFMILDAWMSVLCDVYISTFDHLDSHWCYNNDKLNVSEIRKLRKMHVHASKTIKSLLERTRPQC